MDEYIILRNTTSMVQQKKSGIAARYFLAPNAIPKPKIEIERLSAHALTELQNDPQVRAIAPRFKTHLIKPVSQSLPKDSTVWGIGAVGADLSPYTGQGVVVAVLDTGIDQDHVAFQGMTLQIKDFSGTDKQDINGHGTHCAGTIFGRNVEGRRIGIAQGVNKALIGKVFNDEGEGSSEMIYRGMQWAVQEGANIISMSIGFDFPGQVQEQVDSGWPIDLATSQALEGYRENLRMFDALMAMLRAKNTFNRSPIVIAAAGNESRREIDPQYKIAASVPAAADGVISVAAVGRGKQDKFTIAEFSNSLAQVAAPGVDIISAWPGGGLESLNGTSMACPHVAGVAALWWEYALIQKDPLIVTAVAAYLTSTARKVFESGFDSSDFGFGLVTAPQF